MTERDLISPRRLVRRSDAAEYVRTAWGIPLSPKTMAKQAVVGGGPKFRKAGRVPLYDTGDLDNWARSRLSELVTSTSQLKGLREKQARKRDPHFCRGSIAGTGGEAARSPRENKPQLKQASHRVGGEAA